MSDTRKQRPILFKPHLLDLVASGAKNQTRRVSHDWLKLAPGDVLWCKERLDKLSKWNASGGVAQYARDLALTDIDWRWERSWLSPLHMPREAARVFLEVTEPPHLERVGDITDEDARAEGFAGREAFFTAWNTLHPDAWSTDLVVVVKFKLRGAA